MKQSNGIEYLLCKKLKECLKYNGVILPNDIYHLITHNNMIKESWSIFCENKEEDR